MTDTFVWRRRPSATKATSDVFKRQAQIVNIRDSILWTAGETRRTGK